MSDVRIRSPELREPGVGLPTFVHDRERGHARALYDATREPTGMTVRELEVGMLGLFAQLDTPETVQARGAADSRQMRAW